MLGCRKDGSNCPTKYMSWPCLAPSSSSTADSSSSPTALPEWFLGVFHNICALGCITPGVRIELIGLVSSAAVCSSAYLAVHQFAQISIWQHQEAPKWSLFAAIPFAISGGHIHPTTIYQFTLLH